MKAAGLALLCILLWSRGAQGPYHFDDAITPLGDPASHSLAAFAHELPRTIRPLTKLTYALEASAGLEERPAVRRMISIALLAAAAVIFFALCRALVPRLGVPGAAAAALLFAVHPIHAEGVLALAGRPAALSGALILGALLPAARDRPRLAGVLFLGAGLARETAIAALLPLVALELAQARSWREHLRRLAPALAATALLAAWLAFTPRYRLLAAYSLTSGRPVAASRIAQISAIPVGMSLYARVDRLSLDHGEALATSAGDPRFILGLALIGLALVTTGLALRARAPAVAVGATLWIAAIVPTQSLIPKLDPLTERPLELALAGLILLAAPLVARARMPALAVAVTLTILLGIATWTRAGLYRSDLALWADAAHKSERNPRPHYNYGILLEEAGRPIDALAEIELAYDLAPFDQDIEAARSRLRHAQPKGELR